MIRASTKNYDESDDSESESDTDYDNYRYLNEEQFYLLLDKLRLNDNKNFSRKMFSIFCFNTDGLINYYEFFHRIFQFWMIKRWQQLHKKPPLIKK